eukprot:6175154-Pleurochrysis_carterae.AAC.1
MRGLPSCTSSPSPNAGRGMLGHSLAKGKAVFRPCYAYCRQSRSYSVPTRGMMEGLKNSRPCALSPIDMA